MPETNHSTPTSTLTLTNHSAIPPRTFIFIGRSGCGKGTQVKVLRDHLSKNDPDKREHMYLETGARFREFIKGTGYTNKVASHIAELGQRQPDFLAVWNWAHVLIEKMDGEEHLIVDGMPRSYQEALVFDTAITFYGRQKPTVVYIDVSKDWSRERLKGRAVSEGRKDDVDVEAMERRLEWFDTDVYPAVKFFEQHPGYHFVHINGEQTIDEVSRDILGAVGF